MKNIIRVFRMDLKRIVTNPVALIIVAGLCILPSLYAWVNIKACWDPYSNTKNILVAIVNNDKTVDYDGKKINIGNSVVDNLKKNNKLGWRFVSHKEADLGIVDGTYNAVIEMPEDFTSKLLSVASGNPQKPQIVYKVDTKANPVAGKITGVAKDTLTDQITDNFVSTVNETAFSAVKGYGQDAEKNKQNIIKLKDDIILISKNMNFITDSLNSINNRSSNLSTFLVNLKTTMPSIESGLNIVQKSNADNKNLLQSTKSTLNKSLDSIQFEMSNSQASLERTQALLNSLGSSVSNMASSQTSAALGQVDMQLGSISDNLGAAIDYFQKMNETSPNQDAADLIVSLKNIQSSINSERDSLKKIESQYSDTSKVAGDAISGLVKQISDSEGHLNNAVNQYAVKTRGTLNSISDGLIQSTNDASDILGTAQDLNNQIDKLLSTAIDGSELSQKVSGDLEKRLLEYKDIIDRLAEKLALVNNNDLVKIITILQDDPKFMANFISDPIEIKNIDVNAIPNYGSGMAPVYTVLAIWVGTLLLGSILKSDVSYFKGIEEVSILQRHFGKMLTFVFLALIQSLIVSVGDKVILGVYTVSAPLLIAFSLVSGFTFAIITYTLISLFGDVGKALSIVFLIVQIAGSGASYPIQVDPLIFRIIQPFLPFTYSVGGFREAIGGPNISTVVWDFIILFLIAGVFIALGYFLKKPLYSKVHRFEEKFKESGIAE